MWVCDVERFYHDCHPSDQHLLYLYVCAAVFSFNDWTNLKKKFNPNNSHLRVLSSITHNVRLFNDDLQGFNYLMTTYKGLTI